jgi:hypothetical protein
MILIPQIFTGCDITDTNCLKVAVCLQHEITAQQYSKPVASYSPFWQAAFETRRERSDKTLLSKCSEKLRASKKLAIIG